MSLEDSLQRHLNHIPVSRTWTLERRRERLKIVPCLFHSNNQISSERIILTGCDYLLIHSTQIMVRDIVSYRMTGLVWRQRRNKLLHCCHFDLYCTGGTYADKWFTVSQKWYIYSVNVRILMLHIIWWFRRVSFKYRVYVLGQNPGRASTYSCRIKMTILSTQYFLVHTLKY